MLGLPRISAWSGTTPITVYGSPSKRMLCPTMLGSAAKRARQNASDSTTEALRSTSSARTNVRPTIGFTPSASKIPLVTHWRGTASAPSGPLMTMLTTFMNPPIASNDRLRAAQSLRFTAETALCGVVSVRSQIVTRRSGSGRGKSRSSTRSTSANNAPFAPMPIASVKVTMTVNIACVRSMRTASRRSCRKSAKTLRRGAPTATGLGWFAWRNGRMRSVSPGVSARNSSRTSATAAASSRPWLSSSA